MSGDPVAFSEEVQAVLYRALVGAREAGHAIITPEHLALEIILEEETSTYLERCGTDLVAVESRLRACLGRIQACGEAEAETKPTAAFQRIVATAIERTEADQREFLMLRDLFLAMVDERGTVASAAILESTREPEMFEELRIPAGRPANQSRLI
jgi:ATP-dependent Clp protease ATP-binding subunit ClpA